MATLEGIEVILMSNVLRRLDVQSLKHELPLVTCGKLLSFLAMISVCLVSDIMILGPGSCLGPFASVQLYSIFCSYCSVL